MPGAMLCSAFFYLHSADIFCAKAKRQQQLRQGEID
jgi:hypothetical protein